MCRFPPRSRGFSGPTSRREGDTEGHTTSARRGWGFAGVGVVAGVGLGLLPGGDLSRLVAAEVDVARLPPPAAVTVDYTRDIQPLFEAACFRCHAGERPKSRYRLTDRDAAIRGGAIGPAIVVGDSAASPLIHYVARLVEDLEMPPVGQGEALTAAEVGLLRAWIDQGAVYPDAAARAHAEPRLTVTSGFRWIGVEGNAARFREHTWLSDGAAGGWEEIEWEEPVGSEGRFTARSRAWFGADDYEVKLSYDQRDVGFIRGGYSQYRRWFDGAGGYYAPFGVPPLGAGDERALDTGQAWFEAGLAKPDVPRLTLGYAYAFRDGERSTLQWGLVGDPATGVFRAIHPAAKSVDEREHRIRFDVEHTVAGFELENRFRAEFADRETSRVNVDSYALGAAQPDVVTRYDEGFRSFHGANTLRVEKPVLDWLRFSGGFLYSNLDGDGSFSSATFIPGDPSLGPFVGTVANDLVLRREAYVFNANSQLGPWEDFTLAAGVQADWSRQEGFGTATVSGFPSPLDANLDRFALGEHLTLRYTGLPYTVLYADAQLQQEAVGQYETQTVDDGFSDARDFLRDTDAEANLWDVRTGFTVSPWARVALDAAYRHRENETTYDPLRDFDGSTLPGNGYPGFVLGREVTSDELGAKVVWRAARWLKTTLKYQWVASEIATRTADATDRVSESPLAGGWLRSGQHHAHVYSFNASVQPYRRLFLNGTFSYSDAHTSTGAGSAAVVPYEGGIYTVLTTAGYALDARTDCTASYAFSRADYAQNHWADGLPLGIRYDRHALVAGLKRRFKGDVSLSLQYGFYLYEEPTAAGAADYTAHGLFAYLTKRLR